MQILKDDIRVEILRAALEIFSTLGYEKATMQSIADKCSIGKSNLYRYFPSKEKIFLEIISRPMADIQKLTGYLTDEANLTGTTDDIATRYAEQIYPIVKNYRREILMIIKSNLMHDGVLYRDDLMYELLANFLRFDVKKLPKDFIHTLANMLLTGLEHILTNCRNDSDLQNQLAALLKYHVWGTLAFTNLR